MVDALDRGIKLRKNLSSRYRQALKNLKKRLPEEFAAKNVVDLTPSDISDALTQMTNGTTAWKNALRMFSAILGDLVNEGSLHENPCARVTMPKIKSNDEVRIYTVKELKSLFAACKNYDEGDDPKCGDCAVPFAFLAFAGIRPTEVTRLGWDDVNLELGNIRLSGAVTKTGKTRNVRINPTLRAWIETIPENQRTGRIIPGRWTQKATRVRKEAGLDGRKLQDALRHTYGSYMLATENDLNALKSDMGHQHCDVFFNHYHNALTQEEAAPYWKIVPPI
jgi:integrase